jgi:hypothetical protein
MVVVVGGVVVVTDSLCRTMMPKISDEERALFINMVDQDKSGARMRC